MAGNQADGGGAGEVSVTETWLKKHSVVYMAATRHAFVHAIRDGSIEPNSFKRWLGQDYLFVRAFVPFLSSVLLKAWKESDDESDMDVLLGGIAALNDEIAWFKKEASKWGLKLSAIVAQQENQKYCRFLESLMGSDVEYTVAIVALWAIEVVYQQSFAQCLEEHSNTPGDLKETCQRWGNEEFGRYCCTLQKIADQRLVKATESEVRKAELTFLSVLEHEVGFWNMSHG